MTLEVCTEALRQQDPDRFGAVLVADARDRPALVTLYALNLEIARAPFHSAEPMLAEMRLQWWIDRLAAMGLGTAPPNQDVLTPLWQIWGNDAGMLVPLAEARRRDCAREAFDTPQDVADYVSDTAGRLMGLAATRLGADASGQVVAADQGLGAGLAAWLRALPRLQQLGLGLRNGRVHDAIHLARLAQDALDRATARRRLLPGRAAAAVYSGAKVRWFLSQVANGKADPFQAVPEITPFQRRSSLAWLALSGRWWK